MPEILREIDEERTPFWAAQNLIDLFTGIGSNKLRIILGS